MLATTANGRGVETIQSNSKAEAATVNTAVREDAQSHAPIELGQGDQRQRFAQPA